MDTAISVVNFALMAILITFVLRAAALHNQASKLRHEALTMQMRAAWCHTLMLQGWHPWSEYAPAPDVLVDVLFPGEPGLPRILRAPKDLVPSLEAAWWRPFEPREAVMHIGGIG